MNKKDKEIKILKEIIENDSICGDMCQSLADMLKSINVEQNLIDSIVTKKNVKQSAKDILDSNEHK